MPTKNDRIVIDTNLWISFLLKKDYSKFDKLFWDKTTVLLFSKELLDEFVKTAERPKFAKYFTFIDLQDLLIQISLRAIFIDVKSEFNVCRDFKDNFLLALAKDGNASHLITGDKDLLVLKKFENTTITTISTYLLED